MALNDSYYVNDWLNFPIALLDKVKILENTIIGLADLIAEYEEDSELSKAILAITDSIKIEKFKDFFTGRLVIEDDLFIHLNSQLGTGYVKKIAKSKMCH